MTLLSSIQSVARRIGIGAPAAVVTATDDMTLQLLELARESVEEICAAHGWQNLRVLSAFFTVADTAQPGSLPSDYDRMAPGKTMWNLSQRLPVRGPANPDEWAQVVASRLGNGPNLIFRLINRQIYLYPAPAAGQTVTFEYISNLRVIGNTSALKETFDADTDTVRFPEHLLVKDLRWRWKAAKGLNYSQEYADFQRAFEREAAADRGPAEIAMAESIDGSSLILDGILNGMTGEFLSPETVAALLPTLPTTLPDVPGVPWNNGGQLAWS